MERLKLLNIMLLAASMLLSCCDKKPSHHQFTDEVKLPTTPIKNQGKTELCWAYAMLSTIETEHIVKGDSVNLSAIYIGRKLKEYQQSKGYRGESQRGMGVTLLNMLPTAGAMDYDVLPDDAPDDLPTPQWVFMLGSKYSPQEFAHSICAPGEYEALTCWPDSPYYKKVEVPTADNWEHNRLLNLPVDTLLQKTERALRNGHPVCWESTGHAMAIIGIAHDEQGKKYFIMKNSWGTDQEHDGLVYMSYASFRKKTLAIVMAIDH